MLSETIKIEVGYEDDGRVVFVWLDKEQLKLARKALAYVNKQEQEEKQRAREAAPTCRNCGFSEPRNGIRDSLCCSKKIVNRFYKKVVQPSGSCELFVRRKDNYE